MKYCQYIYAFFLLVSSSSILFSSTSRHHRLERDPAWLEHPKIIFANCGLTDENMGYLAPYLARSSVLESLDLKGKPVYSPRSWLSLRLNQAYKVNFGLLRL